VQGGVICRNTGNLAGAMAGSRSKVKKSRNELNEESKADGRGEGSAAVHPLGFDPVFYSSPDKFSLDPVSPSSFPQHSANDTQQQTLKLKVLPAHFQKAWDLSKNAAKSIPMTFFMLWIAGSSIQIFSIALIAMNLMNPVKSIFTVQSSRFSSRLGKFILTAR
jgi:hypothetical protein